MSKEIEVKILGINVAEVESKLSNIGAEKISDDIQKILTYDFRDISSEYKSIIYDLQCNISVKTVSHAMGRLKQLFFDLDDLIQEFDETGEQSSTIKDLFGEGNLTTWLNSIKTVNKEVISKLCNPDFIRITEQYRINPNKWIRLRKTGNKTTITVKHILNRKTNANGVRVHSIDDVLEYEIGIDDFDKGKQILELLGYYHKNYQEKRRVSYRYYDIEIDIDFWPHIPAYLEIEASDESKVYETLKSLGYTKADAKFMNADDVYTFYGLNMYDYKDLKFD